jgi:PKD repeat protein
MCSGTEHFQITVDNSQSGVWYQLIRLGDVVDSLAGNGGSLTLQAPLVYGTNQSTNFLLRAYQSASCNPIIRNVSATIDTVYARPYTNTPSVFPGQAIQFLNNSYGDTYLWTFPPQASIQTSTLSTPSITIGTPGQYQISTIVYNNEGCSDTLVQNVYVNANSPAGTTAYCGNTQINPNLLSPYDTHIDSQKNTYITGSLAGTCFKDRQQRSVEVDLPGHQLVNFQ